MRILLLFSFFCFFGHSALQAMMQTDTHTYIVSRHGTCILEINRKTGKEKNIKIGDPFDQFLQITIHKGLVYMVDWGSASVLVFDLTTTKRIKRINVGINPVGIVFHQGFGYVVNMGSKSVTVIDLKCNEVTQTIRVNESPTTIVIHEGLGYVANAGSRSISVIDLKSHTVIRDIPVEAHPNSIAIYEGCGYIVNKFSNSVSIIDLKSHTVTCTISVGIRPISIAICEGLGYVVTEDKGNVYVIDLKAHKVINRTLVGNDPAQIIFHEGFGYVKNKGSHTVSVIELKSQRVIMTIENPENHDVDFSDTHVYLELKKVCPLPSLGLRLFKHPYAGIEGDISYEDGDENFKLFERAALINDYQTAQENFNLALACGHKRAYAVAFYAFVKGVWGATQSDKWSAEFSLDADLNYFSRLDHEKTYPFSFKLKPEIIPFSTTPAKPKKKGTNKGTNKAK